MAPSASIVLPLTVNGLRRSRRRDSAINVAGCTSKGNSSRPDPRRAELTLRRYAVHLTTSWS